MKNVSLLLSCYRASDLIEGYIDFLLAPEIVAQCTLIAVNFPFSHKSADTVKTQLQRYPDLVLLESNRDLSLYDAWNMAIGKSRTEFIGNLNLDDRVTPDYYAYGVDALRTHEADVFSSFSVTTSEIGRLSPDARKPRPIDLLRFADRDITGYRLEDMVGVADGRIWKRNIPHCAPIWRRSLHARHGLFDSRSFDFCADFEFWLSVISGGGKFIVSRHEKTFFFSASGTASDRLSHAENKKIIEQWQATFPPPGYKPTRLGTAHDLLHHCLNLNAICSSEKYYAHLSGQSGFEALALHAKALVKGEGQAREQSIAATALPPKDQPRISVIMPVYNGERFLQQAIDSVLTQDIADLELIVVDDGSSDASLALAGQLAGADRRIRVLRNKRKKGVSGARNTGLEAVQGRFVAFLDADDAYDPGALSARLEALEKSGSSGLVHSRVRFVNETGQDLGVKTGAAKTISYLDMSGNAAHLNSIMGRAEVLGKFSFDENLENGEDWLFLARVLRSGVRSAYVENGGAIYRAHQASTVIGEFARHQRSLATVLDWLYSASEANGVAAEFAGGLATPSKAAVLYRRRLNEFIWAVLTADTAAINALCLDAAFAQFILEISQHDCARPLRIALVRRFLQPAGTLLAGNLALRARIKMTASAAHLDQAAPGLFAALDEALGLQAKELDGLHPFEPSGLAPVTSLAFFPVVTDEAQLLDLLSRCAWFLSFSAFDTIHLPVANEALKSAPWRVAAGMDPKIALNFDALRRKLAFVVANGESDLQPVMSAATVILRWKKGGLPDFVAAGTLAAWEKGKKILHVDPVAFRQEGAHYIDAAVQVMPDRQALIEENQRKFEAMSARLGRFERAYLMATGPSVADYRRFDYTGAITIVCNSVILDEALMALTRPKILVFGDPIFHFGPSQYAAAFREQLRLAAAAHEFTICMPYIYYPLFVSALPDLKDRTIGIPFAKFREFNFDLREEFVVRAAANILTFLMVPLATTFADEVGFLGCDGRPLAEDSYFWKHNPDTQINDKMANIREVHPGFFNIDYNDYYLEHRETLNQQLIAGESAGRRFLSLGFSHIPALHSRAARGKTVS